MKDNLLDHDFSEAVKKINTISSKAFYSAAYLWFSVLIVIVALMASLFRLKLFLKINFAASEIDAGNLHNFLADIFAITFVCMILLLVFFAMSFCLIFIKTASSKRVK